MASAKGTTRGAGNLRSRITFQRRGDLTDEYGNVSVGAGPWADVYTCAARLQPYFSPRSGGVESVMASRLSSKQPYTLVVRSCAETRAVRTDWRAVDAREAEDQNGASPRVFDIKTIVDPDERGQWLEMLVVEGESS